MPTFLKKNLFFLICLSIISLYAIVVRFYQLGKIPTSLYWDEIAILLDAKSIAKTGSDIHGQPWYQTIYLSYKDYKLPVYIWFTALAIKAFGTTELSVRLPSAVISILTIIIGVLLACKIFNKTIDRKKLILSVVLVIAVSPWSIMFARTGFEAVAGQFFLGLSILLFLYIFPKILSFLPVAITAALATYSYYSVIYVWVTVFILALIMQVLTKKITAKLIIKSILILSLTLFTYFLLLIPLKKSPYYAANNQFRQSTQSVLNMTDWALISNQLRAKHSNNFVSNFFSRIFFHRHLLLLIQLAKNYSKNLSPVFIFLNGDSNLRHGTGEHGLFLLPFLPFFLIGLYQLFSKNFTKAIFLSGWWIAALLPASVPAEVPHALRSLNSLLPLSIIIAVGFAYAMQYCHNNINKWHIKALVTVSLSTILLSVVSFTYYYFSVYKITSNSYWQAGFKQLAEKIILVKSKYQKIYVKHNDGRFYLWLLTYAPEGTFNKHNLGAYIDQPLDNVYFQCSNQDIINTDVPTLLVLDENFYFNEKNQFEKQIKKIETIRPEFSDDKYYLVDIQPQEFTLETPKND